MKKADIVYVELKSGYSNNGPAWIGKARYSKSGRTLYFNGKALQSLTGGGIQGNYIDIESNNEYWISGVKKNQRDRHWAGSGKILIDKDVVDEYLTLLGAEKLNPKSYQVVRLDNSDDVRKRVNQLENRKLVQPDHT